MFDLHKEKARVRMFHVKHGTDHALSPEAIVEAASAVGYSLGTSQAVAIAVHAQLMLDANQHINLTRITEPSAVLRLHIVDSLAWLPTIAGLHGPLVDIGSGAGYPGVPLAVALGLRVVLCESIQKKADFLRRVVAEIGLDAEVFAGRAESLAMDRGEFAGTVVARAVAPVASLVELAAPLLSVGGRLIALKGALRDQEIEQGQSAARICGLEAGSVARYRLPDGDEMRTVVEFVKIGRARIRLPRQLGKAQREPLGD